MMAVTQQDFLKKARDGFYVPLVQEVDPELDWHRMFRNLSLRGSKPAFLFESSRFHPKTGRWSLILCDPFMVFRSRNGRSVEIHRDREIRHEGNPLWILKKILKRYPMAQGEDLLLPFQGGCAGLLSYELKNQIEKPRYPVWDPYGVYDIDLGFFDRGIVRDHWEGRTYLFITQKIGSDPRSSFYEASGRLEAWAGQVEEAGEGYADIGEEVGDFLQGSIHLDANAEDFKRSVCRIKDYIRIGDVFQVNLSHVIEFPFGGDLLALYQRAIRINPTCFGAFADFGDYQILCGSPERLIHLRNRLASTRPIAGTRPRREDPAWDRRSLQDLVLSPKERAEHIMLLDLERNDLGRVCTYGSVRVDEMMTIESYSHVHHIVSNIRGILAPGQDVWDLIRSVFPGGTITGAPKVRAMEIIEELEQRARGAYTGSLGYIGFNWNADFNIVIRSLFLKGRAAALHVGSGIVADSDPDLEYEETLDKAKALLKALPSQSTVPTAVPDSP